jgi:hypothetical protein
LGFSFPCRISVLDSDARSNQMNPIAAKGHVIVVEATYSRGGTLMSCYRRSRDC